MRISYLGRSFKADREVLFNQYQISRFLDISRPRVQRLIDENGIECDAFDPKYTPLFSHKKVQRLKRLNAKERRDEQVQQLYSDVTTQLHRLIWNSGWKFSADDFDRARLLCDQDPFQSKERILRKMGVRN